MSDKILIFRQTSDTIRASKLLVAAGIEAKPVSVPDWVSFECGVSLVVTADNKTAALDILSAGKIIPASVHDYE